MSGAGLQPDCYSLAGLLQYVPSMSGREQAGAIPFRWKKGAVEVCLIRNKGRKKWKIPKGFVDPGETPEQAALKEAWEEAGLTGRLVGGPIGSYRVRKVGVRADRVGVSDGSHRRGRSLGRVAAPRARLVACGHGVLDAEEASCETAAGRRRHEAGAEKEAEVSRGSRESRRSR